MKPSRHSTFLLSVFLLNCLTSLVHFIHNGVFLDAYPNMPGWITPAAVYLNWFVNSGIGLFSYLLFRRGHQFIGLIFMTIYGVLGLDGLLHYVLAPMSAHTFAMNFTIFLETATAVVVLVTVAWLMARHCQSLPRTSVEQARGGEVG